MRWGIMHDYKSFYMSMNKHYEANVLKTFGALMRKDLVFRGGRPAYFSTKEQRILAEEEIEDRSKIGPAYLVKFPITKFGESSKDIENLGTLHLLAFLNEPWKIASTQALAINPKIKYSLAKDSKKNYFIIAFDRMAELQIRLDRKDIVTDLTAPGEALLDLEIKHPLFPHITLPVVPDSTISSSFGSGINVVSPLSTTHDLDLAESYNLSKESYMTKDGLFTGDLDPRLDNTNPFKKGSEILADMMHQNGAVMLSYRYEYPYTIIKNTKERVLLVSIDSWFFRIPDSLRQR
jgi:isoleucyl-tRNA synthetase